ncbi:MAG TPA: response regulator [Vicinamibacterales bacterium]|nr:response regulator [Vicinamibacterales bacterium]
MKRILLIEDNAVAANVYAATLRRAGYRVDVASDGEAGLAALAAEPPDLVLLDLMLPKIAGLDVLRQIRARPELAHIPVLVTSNAYTPPRLDELRKAGATQILTKASVSPKDIERVVREAFDARAGDAKPPDA